MQSNLNGLTPSYPKSTLINGRYDPKLADALSRISPEACSIPLRTLYPFPRLPGLEINRMRECWLA